jgi:DNA invertase Pin-like site-specific DNA recombinase
MECRFIAYLRVSTQKRGRSGLGLEGQQAAIDVHLARTGCKLIATYTEVESGRNSARPELTRALAHAKRAKATLIIAKLDRLSRNVAFIANLMESCVGFVACDNPDVNPLTVHVLAAVAEQEARMISERTKAALAAHKARGGRLGTNNLTRKGTQLGGQRAADAHRRAKLEAYTDVLPTIQELRDAGLSYAAIATRLNDDGQTTRRGKSWNASQVQRVLTIDITPTPGVLHARTGRKLS